MAVLRLGRALMNNICCAIKSTTLKFFILAGLSLCFAQTSEAGEAPFFREEPSSWVVFSNSTGAVIPCATSGTPHPQVKWTRYDGTSLTVVKNLRRQLPDGSLVLSPFAAHQYKEEVHSTVYRCMASNEHGAVASRDVRVKAVFEASMEVAVTDGVAATGGVAVLRCLVHPPSIRPFINGTRWLADDGVVVSSENHKMLSGSRYEAFRNGLLLINRVTRADERRRFRCLVSTSIGHHEKESGSPGKLIVTEPKNLLPPRLVETDVREVVREGSTIRLPCVASGHPAPRYFWSRITADGRTLPLNRHDSGLSSAGSGTLTIGGVTLSDSGRYICEANNTMGHDRIEREVIVLAPLEAKIQPRRLTVRSGEDVTINCTTRGGPIQSVHWMKNVKPLGLDHRIRLLGKRVLHISNFRREDTGIYQCLVGNDQDSAQGHSFLNIEEIPPSLRDVFRGHVYQVGETVSLRCLASGSPLPQLSWLLDGLPLPDTRELHQGDFVQPDGSTVVSFVNITHVRVHDAGDYTCRATNDVATVTHTARVDVVGPPYIRPMLNMTVVAGRELFIRCPVAGYPIEKILIEKGGKAMTHDPRYSIAKPGQLSIAEAKKGDQGTYRCVAIGRHGEMFTREVHVNIVNAPVISPFMFTDVLQEGMRSSATCSVVDGDPPVRITWLKDGKVVSQDDPNVQIILINPFLSSLMINNVSRVHSGNYTCLATNGASSTNHTAHMLVRAPPQWRIQPTDTAVIVSSTVTINCQADGEPQPVVRWKYAQDENNDFHGIVSSPHMHVLENGSLHIVSVQPSDKGRYLCEASNAVGTPLSTVVDLIVHNGPHISGMIASVQVQVGAEATLTCHVRGDEPLSIAWNKDGMILMVQDERYVIIEEKMFHGKTSMLRIRGVERGDSAAFTCTATNPYGSDSSGSRLIVQDIPDPPEDVEAFDVKSSSLNLRWTPPYSGNLPITSYTVIYHLTDDPSQERRVTVTGNALVASIGSLQPISSYQFVVIANNQLGSSQRSKAVFVKTKMEAPQNNPTHVAAVAADSKSIRVSWRKPKDAAESALIKGYYIGYKQHSSSEPFIYKTVETFGSLADSKLEYTLTDLHRDTKYAILVQAFNDEGAGPPSPEINTKTFEYDPPPTPAIQVLSVTSSTIHLQWDAPRNNNSIIITGYILHFKHTSSEWKEERLFSYQKNKILEGLLCGTAYQVFLSAFNDVGRGEPSEVVEVATQGKVAIAPSREDFVITNHTAARLLLSAWNNGGCPIRHFVIQYKQQISRDWILLSNNVLSDKQYLDIGDLHPATWYDLTVTAHNDAGDSEADYQISTLTIDGATIPPPMAGTRQLSVLRNADIFVPVICLTLVLLVIMSTTLYIILRRRRDQQLYAQENFSLNTYGKNAGTPSKDLVGNHCSVDGSGPVICNDHETLYYGTHYTPSHIDTYHYGKTTNTAESTMRRSKSKEHTYEVPRKLRPSTGGSPVMEDRFLKGLTTPKEIYEEDEVEDDVDDAPSKHALHHRFSDSNAKCLAARLCRLQGGEAVDFEMDSDQYSAPRSSITKPEVDLHYSRPGENKWRMR